MVHFLRALARALLPTAIRKPLADRFYAAVTIARNASSRYRPRPAVPRLPDAPAVSLLGALQRRAAAVAVLARSHARHNAQRLLTACMPFVWARPPHGMRVRLCRPLVLAGLRVVDRVFEHRFSALLTHALPPRTIGNDRLRVCLLIGTLGPGGAERQATNSLVGLRERYDVDLQALVTYLDQDSQRFFAAAIRAGGVPVDAVTRDADAIGLLAGCGHPDAPRLAAAIATELPASLHDVALYTRELLLRAPDVVHLWLDEVNVRAGLAAVLAGVPRIVVGTRSVNPSHFSLFQPYMRAGYRVLTTRGHVAILNNSDTGARDYERWVGLATGQCTVLRNGFDFEGMLPPDPEAAGRAVRARLGLADTDVVVGGVMRFSEEKRPLLWLDAAEQLLRQHPGIRFLLVGDGVQRAEVEARAARPPLTGRVLLPGHDQRPYDTMCAMNVLFLSSIHEGLPNVLIEAQALGVPVVTMPAGGAVEALRDGDTGWIVHGGNAAAAAQVMADAIGDPGALRAAGARGQAFARRQFGYERMLAETARIYGHVPRRSAPLPAASDDEGGEFGYE